MDDDDDVRHMLRTIFENEGWEVDEAQDGPQALERHADQSADVVVLDHMMPGKTGMDVAQEMRDDGYSNPIILFSAYLSSDIRKQAEKMRIFPCSKVDLNSLVRVVRTAMGETAT